MGQTKTINYGEIISAVVKADNSLDTSRACDIQAQVRISQGKVEAVEQGTLTKEGQPLADFSSYTEGQLSINFQPAEGGTDTLYQAITQFIDQLRQTAAQAAQAYAIGDSQQEEGGQA